MCGNNRSAGIFKDIVECLIRGVSDIDDHSEAVHFCDHFPAERAQSVPTLSLRGGVRYFIVTVMGQGYVPYPKLMKNPEQRERLLDRSPVLHTYEYGNESFSLIPQSVIRRECK